MKKIEISVDMKIKHYRYFFDIGPKNYKPELIYYSFIKYHKDNNYESDIIEVKEFCAKFSKEHFKFIIDYIDENFKNILVSKPEKILQIETGFYNYLEGKYSITSNEDLQKVNNILKLIFNYNKFVLTKNSFWSPIIYNKSLNISICPYCNTQYTFTQKVKGFGDRSFQIRPDLDHFFTQSKHPMLVISIYNLVPSCSICNSKLKGNIDGILNKSTHPFLEGFDNIAYFKREFSIQHNNSKDFYSQIMGIDDNYKLSLNPYKISDVEKVKTHEETYQLTTRYELYKDIINKSIKRSLLYSHNYLTSLDKSYNFKEFKRTLTNEMEDLDSTILSKVKKDILIKEIIPNMNPKNK